MPIKSLSRSFILAISALVSLVLFATAIAAGEEKVLHSFTGADGATPWAGLTWDSAGNLYGSTRYGGAHSGGTVFELSPNASGGWTETVLHHFGHGRDGTEPTGDLIWDADGNLYGTTYSGGAHGAGTVFKLTPKVGGGSSEKVLHHFGSGSDGRNPLGTMIWDAAGNLYGTTYYGGSHNVGAVFKLTPTVGDSWSEKVLHHFGRGIDGALPFAGLVWDAAGNLYGTTQIGGAHSTGVVFELTPETDGNWTEQVLHHFGYANDGQDSNASLIWDAVGNLYATTVYGGSHGAPPYGDGVVFELTPKVGGGSTEKVLHNFGYATDGHFPCGNLTWDAAGNLYGTTLWGGSHDLGTVFELTPNGAGGWTERVLHQFGHGTDGARPVVGLIWDAAGNLYGTTWMGGAYGAGTVFEITP